MQHVFVLDTNRTPLSPCHPAKARQLLKQNKAARYRTYPFTIILHRDVPPHCHAPLELKIDPGSRVTGLALVQTNQNQARTVVWAAEIHHKGHLVKKKLDRRRAWRRSRRSRKTRYRPPRFDNRGGDKTDRRNGWLPPSLWSRIDNITNWTRKLLAIAPITSIAIETVRFDTQKLDNPEISGVEYQQGELLGYEIWEYLLDKYSRKCVYARKDSPCSDKLEKEHIIPRSRGGSNRISNLAIACTFHNQEKGNQTAAEYGFPNVQSVKGFMRDVAAMNAVRYRLGDKLKQFGLPVTFWSGGRTKFNRVNQGYKKAHWIDAACVGETGAAVHIPDTLQPLHIYAVGRGSRQMCTMDKYGFPRNKAKQARVVHGFKTGDIVKTVVPPVYMRSGKPIRYRHSGTHVGKVTVRSGGSFDVTTRRGRVGSINWRFFKLLQYGGGYRYEVEEKETDKSGANEDEYSG